MRTLRSATDDRGAPRLHRRRIPAPAPVGAHREALVPCLLLVGVGYGGLLPAIPILSVYYWGRAHLGAILGVYEIPYDVAAAGSPLLTARLFDRCGSYAVPELVNATCALLGLLVAVFGLSRVDVRAPATLEPRPWR